MKVLSVVGARPEFIQAAPVSRALSQAHHEVLVHTGQHYDAQMSQVFFDDLGIAEPAYNLGVGSGRAGQQTGEMLSRLEDVVLREQPDLLLVRGDTNSTLAGALVAAKLQIPLAHIEAGARSFNRAMPEEINRVVTDHLSDILLCITPSAVGNLQAEGIIDNVHVVGDVMIDAALHYLPIARQRSRIQTRLGLLPDSYLLATVHRAGNTDDPRNLAGIVTALNALDEPVVFPVHPRTRGALDRLGLTLGAHIRAIEPVGYLDMLALEAGARAVLTDSGGVTREAYFLGIPCLTLREETEHTETVAYGWNLLVGTDPERILHAVRHFQPRGDRPDIYGDGAAAERIVAILDRPRPGARREAPADDRASVPLAEAALAAPAGRPGR